MALELASIQEIVLANQAAGYSPQWEPVRTAFLSQLQKIGMPKPRSNAFFWVPLSLLQKINPKPTALPKVAASPVVASQVAPWTIQAQTQNDIAAILPALLAPSPLFIDVKASADWQEITLDGDSSYMHTIAHVASGAKVRFLWKNANPSTAQVFSAQRLDLQVSDQAEVEIIEIIAESPTLSAMRHAHIEIGANASVRWLGLDCGAQLSRSSVDAHLCGSEAVFEIRALSIIDQSAQSHRRIQVYHEAPGVRSEQFVRHVLLGSSQASCDTLVEILKDVTGTKAHQLVNSLLLSPDVKASAKPTLIIHNDEVEASHGTTCGELDAMQLFYLESRGLSQADSRQLLLNAFVRALIETHPASLASAEVTQFAQATMQRRFPE